MNITHVMIGVKYIKNNIIMILLYFSKTILNNYLKNIHYDCYLISAPEF